MRTRRLAVVAECGLLLATALALSQFKLYQLPSGGSVSLGAFPILLLASRRGIGWGTATGILLGLLVMAFRPFVVGFWQFLLDYPLAYGSLGLAGLFPWKTEKRAALSIGLAGLARLSCHVAAGVLFFMAKSTTIRGAFWGSLTYNLAHMLPETILCALLGMYLARGYQSLARGPQTDSGRQAG